MKQHYHSLWFTPDIDNEEEVIKLNQNESETADMMEKLEGALGHMKILWF